MSDDRGRGSRELAGILRDDLRRAEVESPSFERLVDYVEGRLTHEEREELEERLADDAVLRAEVDGLRELHGQMGGRPAAAARPARIQGRRGAGATGVTRPPIWPCSSRRPSTSAHRTASSARRSSSSARSSGERRPST